MLLLEVRLLKQEYIQSLYLLKITINFLTLLLGTNQVKKPMLL